MPEAVDHDNENILIISSAPPERTETEQPSTSFPSMPSLSADFAVPMIDPRSESMTILPHLATLDMPIPHLEQHNPSPDPPPITHSFAETSAVPTATVATPSFQIDSHPEFSEYLCIYLLALRYLIAVLDFHDREYALALSWRLLPASGDEDVHQYPPTYPALPQMMATIWASGARRDALVGRVFEVVPGGQIPIRPSANHQNVSTHPSSSASPIHPLEHNRSVDVQSAVSLDSTVRANESAIQTSRSIASLPSGHPHTSISPLIRAGADISEGMWSSPTQMLPGPDRPVTFRHANDSVYEDVVIFTTRRHLSPIELLGSDVSGVDGSSPYSRAELSASIRSEPSWMTSDEDDSDDGGPPPLVRVRSALHSRHSTAPSISSSDEQEMDASPSDISSSDDDALPPLEPLRRLRSPNNTYTSFSRNAPHTQSEYDSETDSDDVPPLVPISSERTLPARIPISTLIQNEEAIERVERPGSSSSDALLRRAHLQRLLGQHASERISRREEVTNAIRSIHGEAGDSGDSGSLSATAPLHSAGHYPAATTSENRHDILRALEESDDESMDMEGMPDLELIDNSEDLREQARTLSEQPTDQVRLVFLARAEKHLTVDTTDSTHHPVPSCGITEPSHCFRKTT
ncbi:hypothetical protein DL93DRAFT_1664769 [Clavulina sp. PMI_390]|nr:hypothetical protein DL93DRAFT_1664769 [Clavulina sp. PMI_390]